MSLQLALTFWSQPQVVTDSWVELASTITLLAFVIGAYKHVECHVHGCHRVGRFPHGHYKLCHLHHPEVPDDGRITAEDVAKVPLAAPTASNTRTHAAAHKPQASS